MSFFDDASLAFLPSGAAGKDGKAYSIKPTDGTGDFTFSRGSNLTATRIGADGLIEKGRENLLLRSNQFDTTWANIGTSPTSGQSGYDGSSDAWLLTKSAASARIQQSISVSGVKTISLYAKANASAGVTLRLDGGTNPNAKFDLVNGVLFETSGDVVEAKIESVGNGWYRCSMSTDNDATYLRIYPLDSSGSTAPTSGSIYIQDAQLEIGLAATDYIESGATTGKAGLLEDEPRFDYSGGATCPSLLLEPSRTNEIIFSEYFGSSEWIKRTSDGTAVPVVTDNYAVSPEGVQNAARVVVTKPSTDNDFAVINNNNGLVKSAGDKFTLSVYLKATDASQVGKIVDIYTYEIGGAYRAVKSHILTNDWVRLDAIGTFIVSTGNVELINIGKARSSAGGTTLANMATDFLVYGAQFEQASYPTSYIPNHSGGSVTRGADSALDFSSSVNNDSFTFFFEGSFSLADSAFYDMRVLTAGGNHIGYYKGFVPIYNLGSGQSFYGSSLAENTNHKVLFMYDGVNAKFYRNGSLYHSVAASGVGTFVDGLVYNTDEEGLKIKQLLYFPTALSDADCITLTTL